MPVVPQQADEFTCTSCSWCSTAAGSPATAPDGRSAWTAHDPAGGASRQQAAGDRGSRVWRGRRSPVTSRVGNDERVGNHESMVGDSVFGPIGVSRPRACQQMMARHRPGEPARQHRSSGIPGRPSVAHPAPVRGPLAPGGASWWSAPRPRRRRGSRIEHLTSNPDPTDRTARLLGQALRWRNRHRASRQGTPGRHLRHVQGQVRCQLGGEHRRLTGVRPKPHHPRTPPSTATSSGHSGGERNGDVDHAP